MALHDDNFARGIAMVLQGESLKASCYVTHGTSLGTLREKMVSNFVRHETPERFRVETGLVRNRGGSMTSRQCDLLVHEPALVAPLYRWEDFVIVNDTTARAVIQVKSCIKHKDFKEILCVHNSITGIEMAGGGGVFIPTFGYGLNGVTFETFLGYLQEALTTNRLKFPEQHKHISLPLCINVQDKSYLGIRPLCGKTGKPRAFCVVDFTKATDKAAHPVDGIETGFFLQFYTEVLRQGPQSFEEAKIYEWFNKLPIEADGKAWLTPDGVIHKGDVL